MEQSFYTNKKILIIGGTGTIGTGIVKSLLKSDPKVIRVFSRDEYKQFEMSSFFDDPEKKLRFLIGDVRDYARVRRASEDIDIIFHLAALKHVPACEYNPYEAIKTNILGTQNVIDSAIKNKVPRVVITSSDKAIGPTNVYGSTKLLAERLVHAANYSKGTANTIFSSVRFGNVLGSRGSIVPKWVEQMREMGKVTVTVPEMSRFYMSIDSAVTLLTDAVRYSIGGEIFVLKMPVLILKEFVDVVIEEACKKYSLDKDSIEIQITGLRTGEKMFEELMTRTEAHNAYELPNMYVVTPDINDEKFYKRYSMYPTAPYTEYSSADQTPLTKDEIRELILKQDLI